MTNGAAAVYEGYLVNDKCHGLGILKQKDSNGAQDTLQGIFSQNEFVFGMRESSNGVTSYGE